MHRFSSKKNFLEIFCLVSNKWDNNPGYILFFNRSLVITFAIAYANIDEIKRPAQSWHHRKFQIRKSLKFEMVTLNNYFFKLFLSSWLHYVQVDDLTLQKILLNINTFSYILFQQKFFTVCIRLFDSIKSWHNCT